MKKTEEEGIISQAKYKFVSCIVYLFYVIPYKFHTKYIKNLCFE